MFLSVINNVKMISRTRCCLILYLTSFKLVQSEVLPLEYDIHYSKYFSCSSAWSGTCAHHHESTAYPLIDYRDHAKTFDEFEYKYPTLTIETDGEATSPDTFGDTGAGQFGTRTFETIDFNHKEFYTSRIVFHTANSFWWDTGVELSVRFKTINTQLYLQCYVNGWIYSGGAVWRKLDFGLSVTKITFHPRTKVSSLEYDIHYSNYYSCSSAWSGTCAHHHESTAYPLVDYRDHAKTFDEFVEKHPTFTVETYGRATSPDTFGDAGAGKFGTRSFETIYFNHKEFYTSHIVFRNANSFWWNTGVELSVRFKTVNTQLYLQCYVNGWIYSGGAVWRKLDFGLSVTKIIFHARTKVDNIYVA